MHKTYNPFKLWGSWIGFIVGIIPIIYVIILGALKIEIGSSIPIFFYYIKLNPLFYLGYDCHEAGCGGPEFLATPFVFFLMGYILHLVIRKFRNIPVPGH